MMQIVKIILGNYYDNGLGTEQNDQLAFIGTQNLMNKIESNHHLAAMYLRWSIC